LDLGLNNAIIRYVAQYRAQKDDKGQENFLAISLVIYLAMGVLISLFGLLMYLNVDTLFGDSLTVNELEKSKTMLLFLIFNIAIALPGGAFTGICNGYEQFVFPRIVSLIKYVTRTILVFAILYAGSDALGLVILDTVMNFLFILSTIVYVYFKLKVRFKLHNFNTAFIKEIFGYSIWIFVFGLVYQFQWRSGQIILGATTNTTLVAVFGVGVMLGLYFLTFGNVINGLVLPKVVKSVYANNSSNETLTQEMVKVSRITMLLLFYIFGGFLVLGREFLFLWVGESYKASWLVAVLIMAAYIMPISQGYAHAILEAKKRMRFKALSSLILSAMGIVAGGFLSKEYGLNGMIYGIFGALVILQITVLFYYHYVIKLDMKQYFLKGLLPYFMLFLITSLISSYGINFLDRELFCFKAE